MAWLLLSLFSIGWLALFLRAAWRRRLLSISAIDRVDQMSPAAFEMLVALLLTHEGWQPLPCPELSLGRVYQRLRRGVASGSLPEDSGSDGLERMYVTVIHQPPVEKPGSHSFYGLEWFFFSPIFHRIGLAKNKIDSFFGPGVPLVLPQSFLRDCRLEASMTIGKTMPSPMVHFFTNARISSQDAAGQNLENVVVCDRTSLVRRLARVGAYRWIASILTEQAEVGFVTRA